MYGDYLAYGGFIRDTIDMVHNCIPLLHNYNIYDRTPESKP